MVFELISQRVNLIMEYLEQFLSDKELIEGKINFDSAKIDGQNVCVVDIYVFTKKFERHFNLGIPIEFCYIFYEQLFSRILEIYLEDSILGCSRFYTIRSFTGRDDFSGIDVVHSEIGSKIQLNFLYRDANFKKVMDSYNQRISEYVDQVTRNNIMSKENVKKISKKSTL